MNTNFAYSESQWAGIFNSNFPIKKSKLGKNEGYFHYTSVANALNILSKAQDDITLYASHFLFLNDGEELINGLKMSVKSLSKIAKKSLGDSEEILQGKQQLKENLEVIKAIKPNQLCDAPNHFIICFCKDGNLLTQWQYYGKECGIAIEFDLENCEYGGFAQNAVMEDDEDKYLSIVPRDIIYEDIKKKEIIAKNNEKVCCNIFTANILSLKNVAIASFMKHEAFKNEKEVRLLFSPICFPGIKSFDLSKDKVDFRESNGVLKPYIKVHIRSKLKEQNPIKSITVGPGNNQQLIYNAILKLAQMKYGTGETVLGPIKKCKSQNYEFVQVGNVEIRRSTIPFRA